MSTNAPVRLLGEALRRAPGRPLVTFYDDATGERTELSVATFDNWVAKTSNLVVDGLGLGAGARVSLRLPAHWQTAVWLAACWTVGADVSLDGTGAVPGGVTAHEPPDLLVCGPELLDGGLDADEVVALSLRPLGLPFAEPLAPGVTDYAAEVAGYGDRYGGPPADGTGVTEVEAVSLTGAALVDAAADAAARWSLGTGGRLLTTLAPDTVTGLLALLPAALAADGSVVVAIGYDSADVEARLAGERLTARAR